MSRQSIEPFAVAPGEGLAVENAVGGVTTFKAMAATSGGAYTALEGVAAPGEGPPLHVHRDQDELIYTLEGDFRIRLGEVDVVAGAGSFTFIPRGTPHTWQNVGDTRGRFFAALAPSAPEFEQFFVRYAALSDDERDASAFARIADETRGMDVVGPPLAERPRPFSGL